jgi:hypothetical protein
MKASTVSNLRQLAAWQQSNLDVMANFVTISSVEKDGEDGVIVTFSDGTTGGYVV